MFCDEEIESWRAAQRRFVFDGADVRQSFLTEFEEFLFSCKWTDSDVAKEIVGYIQNGTPLNQIGGIVGLKNSAFRMRISRMLIPSMACCLMASPAQRGSIL